MNAFLMAAGGNEKELFRYWQGLQEFSEEKEDPISAGERCIVIRWGKGQEPVPERYLQINHQNALRRFGDARERDALLRLNRIPVSHRFWRAAGAFRVLVCDSGICTVYAEGQDAENASRVRKIHAERLARRALYCLGLDFAQVRVGIFPKKGGRTYLAVLDVDTAPELPPAAWRRLAARLRTMAAVLEIEEGCRGKSQGLDSDIRFGADPEFVLLDRKSRKLLMASDFFPYRGKIGHDARPLRIRTRRYPLAEIRLAPAPKPDLLLENLDRCLRMASRRLSSYRIEWLAGSRPFEGVHCGGHLHISGLEPNRRLVRILDHYLGVPLFMCEEPERARERRQRYGFLGDIRRKKHGGFEYRTPASWLLSPQYAYAAFALLWLATRNYPLLGADWLESFEAQKAFYESNQDYFRPLMAGIHQDLRRLSDYPEVEGIVDWFFERIEQKKLWPEREDFRRKWMEKWKLY